MPVCVLTCFGVCGGVQGQNLVKNKPKIADFAPNPENLIWCLDIVLRHPQLLSMVIYDGN